MSHTTKFVRIGFVVFMVYELAVAVPSPDRLPCPVAFKCDTNPPLAWATDGKNCLLFQNDCHLKSQNCQRANNYESTFRAVERDECFKYCHPGCTREMDPICTIHNNASQTFHNSCVWSEKMCETNEEYIFQFRGSCEPNV